MSIIDVRGGCFDKPAGDVALRFSTEGLAVTTCAEFAAATNPNLCLEMLTNAEHINGCEFCCDSCSNANGAGEMVTRCAYPSPPPFPPPPSPSPTPPPSSPPRGIVANQVTSVIAGSFPNTFVNAFLVTQEWNLDDWHQHDNDGHCLFYDVGVFDPYDPATSWSAFVSHFWYRHQHANWVEPPVPAPPMRTCSVAAFEGAPQVS